MDHYKKTFLLILHKFKVTNLMLLIVINIFLTACSSMVFDNANKVPEKVQPIVANHEFDDRELLDVSIKIFNPGELPKDKDKKRGLSDEIRNSEARFIPIHLKYTMQRSGYWGNVRVVPDDNEGSDVLVKGSIEHSDGESIELKIEVVDATNTKWFEKTYKERVTMDERINTEQEKVDTFQDLYNQISNDIIQYRQKLNVKKIARIKQISELRFAQFMSPDSFNGFLQTDEDGQYLLARLPSVDDPMLKRVKSIKARDELLVDTINNYYDLYYSDIWDSYENWRKYRSEEMAAIREIDRKALIQKIIGAAAVIGAIALGASSNSDTRDRTGALRTVMIAGGSYAFYSGIKTSKEAEINKEAIEELDASFSSEVEPIIIEVKGKTMKLTGSAEQQYSKWRKLLNQIYRKETGFSD